MSSFFIPETKKSWKNQSPLARRATESHRILDEKNHTGVSRWPTLVDNTLHQSLRNNNYIIPQNENNFSNREVVFDSFQNTNTQLTPEYINYSKPDTLVKSS